MKDRSQRRWIMIIHSTGEDFNRVECIEYWREMGNELQ